MSDHYRTVESSCEFRQKIERSEFLGIAFPVSSDENFFEELHRIEKKYFDATHHCWAFRLRLADGIRARSSDAGEPSGTAGKPILAAIEGADLCDVGTVVVRWYGGVKLGTGGLGRAYRDTAAETLKRAEVGDRYIYATVRATVPFDAFGSIYRLVSSPDVILRSESFGETNVFEFAVRQSLVSRFAQTLTDLRLHFWIE